jgi:hypothetical protein
MHDQNPHSTERAFMLAALALLLAGCEDQGNGIVDRNGTPPYLSAATVQPANIDLRTITPVNGSYPLSTSVAVQVTATDRLHPVSRVSAGISSPGADSPFQEITLRDDGVAPDATAGDGHYAGTFTWTASKRDIGRFPIRFSARDENGLESNVLEIPLGIVRQNNPPLLSNLTAPDTILLPAGGSLYFAMTVAASDPDGAQDIREVYFRSLDSSDPNRKFYLYDDGSLASGDRVSDDGIYTITVSLVDNVPNVRRAYRFAFQAVDSPGDTSNTILHILTVR